MKFDSVFSYNHSTFKTTSKKMFLFCFIALLLAGCGSKGNNSTENVNSSESNVNEQTHVQKKDTETPEPFDWNGITVSIPNGFNYDSSYSFFHVWKNNTDASVMMYLVVHDLFGYSSLENAIPNFTLSNVPGIMDQTLRKVVSHYTENGIDNVVRTPINSFETECLGVACIHETGTITTKNFDEEHTFSYVAYYSKLKFPSYGEDYEALPSSIFAFVESEDPNVIKTLESVVDYAVKNATIN